MLSIKIKEFFPMETHLGIHCYKANSNVNTEEIRISMLLQCVLIVPAPGKTPILVHFKCNSFSYRPSNTNYSLSSVTTPDFLLSDLHAPSDYLNTSLKAGIPPLLCPAASQLHFSSPPPSSSPLQTPGHFTAGHEDSVPVCQMLPSPVSA